MNHGKELMPYIQPLPNHKEPGQTELMVSMGYTRERNQESQMVQKYDEVTVIYVLLPCKRSELEDWAITLKPHPLADPTNNCPLYSSSKIVSLPTQSSGTSMSLPFPPLLPTLRIVRAARQKNQWLEEDQELGRKASGSAKASASPLPGLERKTTPGQPAAPTHQNQWGSPRWNELPPTCILQRKCLPRWLLR